MSWEHIERIHALRLPMAPKAVLIVLACYSDKAGRNAWPSIATIARKAGCAENTVRRALQDLVRAKLVTVAQGHATLPNCYAMTLPPLPPRHPVPSAKAAPLPSPIMAPPPLQSVARTPAMVDLDPCHHGTQSFPAIHSETKDARERASPTGALGAQEPDPEPARMLTAAELKARIAALLPQTNGHRQPPPAGPAKTVQSDAARLLDIERRRREAARIAAELDAKAAAAT